MKRTYLDWAAAAPVSRKAMEAFTKAQQSFGNPASAHQEGRAARAILEDARTRIARLTGARPEHVIFTAGATEANALAIEGYVRGLGRVLSEIHVLYLPSAHASVVETMKKLATEGVVVEALPLMHGDVDIAALKACIRKETVLVSLDSVSPETGLRHDTRAVRTALPPSVRLHIDASQSPLWESFERTRFQADLLTLDAQKVGGVRGIGALVRSGGIILAPRMEGGGQEWGVRPGTPSPALASAFATALEICVKEREAFSARAVEMRARLRARITEDLPTAVINEGTENAPHIVNVSFPGLDTDYLQALLDEAGFAVATKSACETDAPDGSRAVFALSGDAVRAASTLRISWGPSTSMRDIERFADALVHSVTFLDRNSL